MDTGGILAQVAPYDGEQGLGDFLFDAYAPQVVAFLVVLVIVFLLVVVLPKRRSGEEKPKAAVPDWYPDPWGEPYQRWWNGASWTAAVRPYPWPGPPGPGAAPPGPPAPGPSAPADLPPGPGSGWPPT